MNAFLDERYYKWLVKQVRPKGNYERLMHILYTTEFAWIVPNDDNRVADGKYLRHRFLDNEGIELKPNDSLWMELGCSFLELLVHMSEQAGFLSDMAVSEWFYILLVNSELIKFNDEAGYDGADVEEILERIIWRQYDASGHGGLFPLNEPREDQRHVELWYQLNAYLLERYF